MSRVKAENKVVKINELLTECYGTPECPLYFNTPFQLLVAVVLSAQCRDERVNQVTRKLFADYPDAQTMACLSPEELGEKIKTLGLYRNKATNLVNTARILTELYDGEVPDTLEELIALPGVGRKSANAILPNAFGKPGFAVDTHVIRLSNRLKIADTETPEAIERIVKAQLPAAEWGDFSHRLIQHGRQVCTARKPDCANCTLRKYCPSAS